MGAQGRKIDAQLKALSILLERTGGMRGKGMIRNEFWTVIAAAVTVLFWTISG